MYKYICLFLFSLCFSTNSSAVSAYVEGTVILNNGSELTGLVQFLGFQSQAAKNIKFKKSKSDDATKYASEDIKYLVITNQETPLVFAYTSYNKMKGGYETSFKAWLRIINNCDDLSVYVFDQFSFNKKGEFMIIHDPRVANTNILFKRPGEDIPSEVGKVKYARKELVTSSGKKQRKKMAVYFNDDPKLVSLIEKNNWDATDFAKISRGYCSAE